MLSLNMKLLKKILLFLFLFIPITLWAVVKKYQFEYPECAQKNQPYNLNCHEDVIKKHKVAFQWAQSVYNIEVPSKEGSSLKTKSQLDEVKNIEGYELEKVYDDCKTGFHAIKAFNKELDKCLFAFSGTDDMNDVIADLNFARTQIVGEVQDKIYNDIDSCFKEGKNILVTGHSLGGLLASYFLQSYVLKKGEETTIKGLNSHELEIITWNSPGATELLAQDLTEILVESPNRKLNLSLIEENNNLENNELSAAFESDSRFVNFVLETISEYLKDDDIDAKLILNLVIDLLEGFSEFDIKDFVFPKKLSQLYGDKISQVHYNMEGEWVSSFGYQLGLRLEYPLIDVMKESEVLADEEETGNSVLSKVFSLSILSKAKGIVERFFQYSKERFVVSHTIDFMKDKLLDNEFGFTKLVLEDELGANAFLEKMAIYSSQIASKKKIILGTENNKTCGKPIVFKLN